MDSLALGGEPHHFAFGSGCLWVSNNDEGSVVRIDPTTRRPRGRTAVGVAPHHVAVAGARVLAAVHGRGQVAVLDKAGELRKRIDVDGGPHGVAAVPAGGARRDRNAKRCR